MTITSDTLLSSSSLFNHTDPTATPFRMFGAHCVARRLSLNGAPVFF
ncbi:hypothetical protein AB1E22_00555 [Buttiauxella gaviniae]|uniref:Uncharacterized protein n=1 Tax=Buttiauxella gaviniae TaxID=82990 RepID=A0ABV3NNW8_9ENTR